MPSKKLELTMSYHKRSGRWLIRNTEDESIQFPSSDQIYTIWNELFPNTDFFVGSSTDYPNIDFYAEIGAGTKPKDRQRFCDALASAIARQVPNQCPEAAALYNRINIIAGKVPNDFPGKETLTIRLIDRRSSIPYTAPEVIGMRWNEIAAILSDSLPDPESTVWAREIAELFGQPVN